MTLSDSDRVKKIVSDMKRLVAQSHELAEKQAEIMKQYEHMKKELKMLGNASAGAQSLRRVKVAKGQRGRETNQRAKWLAGDSMGKRATRGEFAVDNPAEINTTPDFLPFKPKGPEES